SVFGNGNPIFDGDTTTSGANNTLYPATSVSYGPWIEHTFIIGNGGTGNLSLGTVTLSGPQATDFSVTQQPADVVSPGNITTFKVRFRPFARGIRTATVNIPNSDYTKNPFDFVVMGNGLSSNADLGDLTLSSGTLSPTFNPAITGYGASVKFN